MKIFALADTHLSLGCKSKPMDIFGDNWKDHHVVIGQNWNNIVSERDIVLVPGDVSWAMDIKQAQADLDFICSLKGRKILLRGNHDYWWSSVSRLNSLYKEKEIYFLQNDCFFIDDKRAICGTRGWKTPQEATEKDDIKVYKREVGREKLSLEAAMRKGCEEIIYMCHYPPLLKDGTETEIDALIHEYPVKNVVYGHLHGKKNFLWGFKGQRNGVNYNLVSADYINFSPKLIIGEE